MSENQTQVISEFLISNFSKAHNKLNEKVRDGLA